MVEQWAPFATRFDGPHDKHGYPGQVEPLPKLGAVYHSMEGSMSAGLAVLANPARRASWTFSNPKVGELLQHYRMGDHTWTSGSQEANVKFVGVENEGVAGEPLTDTQVDNLVELTVWLAQQNEWPDVERLFQLWEHNEMTRFGSAATACPSDRIPWQEIQSRSRKLLSPEEVKEMIELVAYRDEVNLFWLVEVARDTQSPILKRPYPHVPTATKNEDAYGPSKVVGTPGAYTQGQWDSIPDISKLL